MSFLQRLPFRLALCFLLTGIGAISFPLVLAGVETPSHHSTFSSPSALVNHVIIISLDGLRPDLLLQAETTNLKAVWQGGAFSWSAQTVFPSVTLPSHSSMLSGVTIAKHGMTWNTWEPSQGFISVLTVFSIAHQAGLSTAAVVGKTKLQHLASPDVVDYFSIPGSEAEPIGQAAAKYFLTCRPAVMFVHFPDLDSAGHTYGWMSPEQFDAIRRVDQALTPLLSGLGTTHLLSQTLIIVSADHGGHDRTHGTDLPADMTIPWIAFGARVKQNYRIQTEIKTYDTAATTLFVLGLPIPESWDGRPITEAFMTSPN